MFSNKRWTIARRGRHNRAMGLILVLIATILSIPAAIAGDIRAVEIGDRDADMVDASNQRMHGNYGCTSREPATPAGGTEYREG